MPHVLLIDDDDDDRVALAATIRAEGFTVSSIATMEDASYEVMIRPPQVVLADLQAVSGAAIDRLKRLGASRSVVLIVMTAEASVETAIEALRAGVADYLVKPVSAEYIGRVLARLACDRRPSADAESDRGDTTDPRFGSMLGRSAPMRSLYDAIARVAPTEATVLLQGESGTGKEVVAQTLHGLSRRKRRPFVAINCGAISPHLIESEMFGHERGSFTGAERQHRGYFEEADGGTLFLDEITEMPLDLQVKLLRVLETGRFMRIGTVDETSASVRVIAATNRDPMAAVREGRLREDLFHRLNVFPLVIAPLRERGDDSRLLAESFLAEWNLGAGTRKVLAPDLLDVIAAHDWPGNVRELKNFIQRAFILAEGEVLSTSIVSTSALVGSIVSKASISIPMGISLAEAERRLINATLERYNGVRRRTAEVLGISAKTLYNRLAEYGTAPRDTVDSEASDRTDLPLQAALEGPSY